MLFQKPQIGVQPRDLFHGLNIADVRLQMAAIGCIQSAEIGTLQLQLMQVTVGTERGGVGGEPVLHHQRQKLIEIQERAFQGFGQTPALGFHLTNARCQIRSRQFQLLTVHVQIRIRLATNLPHCPQCAEAKHQAQRFGAANMIHRLVIDRIDITASPLHKQCHGPFPQRFLNGSGRKPGDVRGIAAIGRIGNRVTGKIVHYRHRRSIQSIQSQHTDLWIHRPHRRHLIVGRQRIGMPHINRAPVLQN